MLAWYYLSSVALSLHTQTTNPINRTKIQLHISDTVSYLQRAGRLKSAVSTAKSWPAKSLSVHQKEEKHILLAPYIIVFKVKLDEYQPWGKISAAVSFF